MGPCEREPVTLGIDVGDVSADIVAVHMLARLAVVARRCGCELRLQNPPMELIELIELAGLSEVLQR
jgi:ABC-type transporter Mla MlaB component